MLSDRRQQILCALIEEYVSCAMPVGSKTLTDNYSLGVSSATIRNELCILEEAGYITQPHTSAGRVPTDHGYRAFVDHLLQEDQPFSSPEYLSAVEQLRADASELDDLLEQTSARLASMTQCLSVILAPTLLNMRLKQISLISFSEYHFLIVLVTEDGQVYNRHVDSRFPVTSDDLAYMQNLINDSLLGKTIEEVEKGLDASIRMAQGHPVWRTLLMEILACVQQDGLSHAHRLGLSALLAKPEFTNPQNIAPFVRIMEDDTVLFELLNDVRASEADPLIRIGSENGSQSLNGVSVVASKFGEGANAGVIAVIGPKRMDYSRTIAAVKAARHNLQDR